MCNLTQTNDQPIKQAERKCRVWLCIGLVLSLLACGDMSYAASVSLDWDANNEQDLAGYKVYKRMLPSIDYGSPVFSGLPTNPASPQTTITNLPDNTSYGFITTAFDSAGNESIPSNEALITITVQAGGSLLTDDFDVIKNFGGRFCPKNL